MKTVVMVLTLMIMLSGCESKKPQVADTYDRQNAAAAKAHKDFNNE